MFKLNVLKRATLAFGGIGLVAYQVTSFFGDVKVKVHNNVISNFTEPILNLTEGYVFNDAVDHTIESKHDSSFWVFPKIWLPYRGTKGVVSWEITPENTGSYNSSKHQRLILAWSTQLFGDRQLGIGIIDVDGSANNSNNVHDMDFDRLTTKLKDSVANVIELKRMEKGITNKLEVRTGNLCIAGSMGSAWQPWILIEISEHLKEPQHTEVTKAFKENSATDKNTTTIVETPLESGDVVAENESAFKVFILILFLLACVD